MKKKLSVFVVALFIVSLATGTYFSYDQGYAHGYIQGMAEAGGTPTISPDGISDMPWVNATAINVEDFYLNSEDKTDLFEYPEQAASYIIFKEGSTTYAKNGASGQIDYQSTNASEVITNSWGSMSNGGRIIISTPLNLGTDSLTFKLTKYTTSLEFIGLGETLSELTYIGTGYALTIDTDDALVGNYYLKLSGFTITGSTKTSGRNGINIINVGRNAYIENVRLYFFDIGLHIEDTNTVFIDGLKILDTNTGLLTSGGGVSSPNAMYFSNLFITTASNYGIHISYTSSSIDISNFVIDSCGKGIYVDYPVLSLSIRNGYFETNTYEDLILEGTDGSNPIENANIVNIYSSSSNDYFAKIYYGDKIVFRNIYSKNKNNATFWIENTDHELVLDNIESDDPYLLDGNPTNPYSRYAGIVIESRRIGFIAMNGGGTCDEGDVMFTGGVGAYYHTTTKGDNNTAVVMYGQTNNKPIVLTLSGITVVEMEGATSLDDTVVSSNTETKGEVDNTETDPKKIIGYVVQAIGSAGKALVKIP